MESAYCKRVETFECFGLKFEIRKEKREKYRLIFCNNVKMCWVDNLGPYKEVLKWDKNQIAEAFESACKKRKMDKNEIEAHITLVNNYKNEEKEKEY